MNGSSGTLTVFFDDPFWVGVFERVEEGKLSVCKVTFGAEPKDCEVWDFILRRYDALKFGSAVQTELKQRADNPKRRRRNAKKTVQMNGIGTKSQQALAVQREELKTERKKYSREQREAEQERRFAIKRNKRKEKHKGH